MNFRHIYELSVVQLVMFLVIELAHPGSSPRLGTGPRLPSPRLGTGPRLPSPRLSTGTRIFLDLFQDFINAVLSMVANSEVCMMILSISRTCRLSLPEVLIWVGCMCVFMEVSVCTCL